MPLSGRPVVEWSAWWHLRHRYFWGYIGPSTNCFISVHRFLPIQHFIASRRPVHLCFTAIEILWSNSIISIRAPSSCWFCQKAFAFDTQIQDMIVRKYIMRSCDRKINWTAVKIVYNFLKWLIHKFHHSCSMRGAVVPVFLNFEIFPTSHESSFSFPKTRMQISGYNQVGWRRVKIVYSKLSHKKCTKTVRIRSLDYSPNQNMIRVRLLIYRGGS